MSTSSPNSSHEQLTVLPQRLGGGPMGLGDPDDRSLRKVEKEIVIPKMMKERAKELCADEVKEFTDCGKKYGLLLPFTCRKQNNALTECIVRWYNKPEFVEEMTNQFLEERAEFRRTGVPRHKFIRR